MQVLIVCSGNTKNKVFIEEQAGSLRKLGVKVDFFFINKKGAYGYLENLKILKMTFKEGGYDLVHAHYGLSGMLSILQREIPTVITFHGSDINVLSNRFISTLASFFSGWNIFVSNRLYKRLCIKSRNHSIIPCGVDLKLFYPVDKNDARVALGLSIEKKYVLFSSSFNNKCKNYSLAKKALELINGVTVIELSGFSREKVNLLLNACDLLLMTSPNEGSPQVIKEAMACNCPIVSTDVGDIREVVGDTEGCFITSFDPKNVAAKLKMIFTFGKRTNGRQRILSLGLDSKTVAERIFEVYKAVLKEK